VHKSTTKICYIVKYSGQCTWGKKEIFDDNAELMKYLHYVM